MAINKREVRNHLKEIDELTYPLYLVDASVEARIAGEGWVRMRKRQLKAQLDQLRKQHRREVWRMSRLLELHTLIVSVKPTLEWNLRGPRLRYSVSQRLLSETLLEQYNVSAKPLHRIVIFDDLGGEYQWYFFDKYYFTFDSRFYPLCPQRKRGTVWGSAQFEIECKKIIRLGFVIMKLHKEIRDESFLQKSL